MQSPPAHRRAAWRCARGQAAHRATASPSVAAATNPDSTPKGTLAPGTPASLEAIHTVSAPAAPAVRHSTPPAHGKTGATHTPARPSTRTTETSGPANRFATGEITDNAPNVAVVRGTVAACAVNVSEIGPPSARSRPGKAATAQASASRANKTRPATAATDSRKPRSNATVGTAASAIPPAAAKPALASERLPMSPAPLATVAMPHARTADGCTPVATTYRPTSATVTPTVHSLGTRIRVSAHTASAATTTRCEPLTATRCVSPVVRKSLSAWVPASRRRSPSTTPAVRSPPDPGTPASVSIPRARHGPTYPRSVWAQPSGWTTRAFAVAAMPP